MVRLARRKNRLHESVLRRACSRSDDNVWTCPVHHLGKWLMQQPHGSRLIAHVRADTARCTLKRRLQGLDVEHASEYVLHGFRRGHAMDIASASGDLRTILAAGEWSSPEFLKYFDVTEFEENVALQAHIDDSGESDGDV